MEANCSKAAGYVRVVLQERRGWSDDIAEAVRSLDEGEPDAFSSALLLIHGCDRCRSSVNGFQICGINTLICALDFLELDQRTRQHFMSSAY